MAAKNKIFKYFIEAKEELQKVTWPTQKETIRYTVLVIVMTLAMGLYFGVADFTFQKGLETLIGTSSSTSQLPVNEAPAENSIDFGDIQIETGGDAAVEITDEPEVLEESSGDTDEETNE